MIRSRSGRVQLLPVVALVVLTSMIGALKSSSVDTSLRPGGSREIRGLGKIPWEGGHRYYEQFPDAVRAGWADDDFFPVAIWWAVFDHDEDVEWDKSHGINTYVVTNPSNQGAAALMEKHDMSWIGGQLPGMSRDSRSWVGDFLDDEVDGRFEPRDGVRYIQNLIRGLPDHRKIRFSNYTSAILNQWFDKTAAYSYVNDVTDAVSVDQYWLTVDFCAASPYPGEHYFDLSIPRSTCRTPSSYGKTVRMLRAKDAQDGKLQPVWNFIENVSGSPAEKAKPVVASGAQIKAAVMSSLINEARGVVWFSTVFAGPCGSGNAVRSAQRDPKYPCASQIKAMKDVNGQIRELAPVLNTQSTAWDFGPGVEAMLKVRDRDAYVFVMADGEPGVRRIKLPRGVRTDRVEVLFEDRHIDAADGFLVDDFATDSTYHIYKLQVDP